MMLTDIFSAFDPATSFIYSRLPLSLFWLLNFTILFFLHGSFWLSSNRLFWMISLPSDFITNQVTQTLGFHIKGFATTVTPLFLILITLNLTGIIPYVFRTTTHLIFTFCFGLPLWLALIISSLTHAPKAFAAGLLPTGAPDWLSPPLVLIETLRTLVRPITLSFRLAANLRAGHIILGLVGIYSACALFSSISAAFLIFIQVGYTMFEFGICLVQAYIFCLLLSLYADDHPAH